ncbi:MAG: ABC transporter permease [Planctomycetes bacterium]|nr:ABC transporter permease [Planctomycetota bacterium]
MKRLFQHKLAVLGLVIVIMVIALAITSFFWTPFDPLEQDYSVVMVRPGTHGHLLGTDDLGRDILSRIMCGARYTLFIGLVITLLAVLVGTFLGVTSGYFGGVYDMAISRFLDVIMAMPDIILALAIAATLKPGLISIIASVGAVGWRGFARLARAETLKLKEQQYIEAAVAYGSGTGRIILKHVLPNLMPTIIIYSSLYIPVAILVAAALSFLGIGLQPPTPEWGLFIAHGRTYLSFAWWISTVPGIFLMLLILGLNFLGDGLRDALDPRLRGVV